MSLKLTDNLDRDEREPDVASLLRGARVYCAGSLAAMDHEAFEDALTRHGAEPAELTDCTLAVLGEGHWPLAMPGSRGDRLRVLEELDRRSKRGLRIIEEKAFVAAVGQGVPAAATDETSAEPQLFTTARLTELLGVSRERIRAWVKAGLIEPAKTDHGVWQFDFRQVSAARTLCDLAASGVGTDRVRRALALLRKFMPGVERPLEHLANLDRDGQLLVRLAAGDLAEPDGQLHFEFTGGTPAVPPVPGAPSPMRIAPGPKTAPEWLTQGLEQEREGYPEEAAASYRQALLVGGPHAQTCLNLANVLRSLGNRPQALERYAQAVEVDPSFADAWNNLGTLLAELGKPEEAVAAFQHALTADPDDARAHYNLADVLDELGRGAEAEPHWRAYAKADPLSKWGEYARKRLARNA